MDEVKERREWNERTTQRVDAWREYQKQNANKRKYISSDEMSGETDHDKVWLMVLLIRNDK